MVSFLSNQDTVFSKSNANLPSTPLITSSFSSQFPFESWRSLHEHFDDDDELESCITQSKTTQATQESNSKQLEMGLILKAYDDCRQDTLALQVMHLLETIWEAEGIDVPLMVYNVTPARTSDDNKAMGGIIECVLILLYCEM